MALPPATAGGGSKYPAIKPNYEASNASDLYVGEFKKWEEGGGVVVTMEMTFNCVIARGSCAITKEWVWPLKEGVATLITSC